MPTNDPYCRIQERGWVGEGASSPPLLQRRGPGGGGSAGEFYGEGGLPLGVSAPPPTPSSEEEGAYLIPDPIFTPALKLRFLDALAQHGNVRVAAARVGVSRSGVYLVRRRDGAFAAGWIAALGQARFHAEAVLAERALDGVEEPVFYHGEVIAVRRRFDTRLLLAHLARLDALCTAECSGQAPGGAALDFDLALARIAGPEQPGGPELSGRGAPPRQSRDACLAAAAERAGDAYDRTAPQVDPDDPECYDPGAEVWYENDAIRAGEEEAAIYDAAMDAAEAQYAAARALRIAAAEAEAAAEWDADHAALIAQVDALRLGRPLARPPAPLCEVKSLARPFCCSEPCPVCPAGRGRCALGFAASPPPGLGDSRDSAKCLLFGQL